MNDDDRDAVVTIVKFKVEYATVLVTALLSSVAGAGLFAYFSGLLHPIAQASPGFVPSPLNITLIFVALSAILWAGSFYYRLRATRARETFIAAELEFQKSSDRRRSMLQDKLRRDLRELATPGAPRHE